MIAIGLLTLVLGAGSGCDDDGTSAGSGSGVVVELEPDLASRVELTAETWQQPGQAGNAVDVIVGVHNPTAKTVVFHAVGDWTTASGSGRGGQTSDYTVYAGADIEIRLSTRSPDVERLALKLHSGAADSVATAARVAAAASTATRTTSWNTANAWRLVIDRFDATMPVQPTARSVGTASGRLEVCYPTSGASEIVAVRVNRR